jgi:CDP-diglyceride synthetase
MESKHRPVAAYILALVGGVIVFLTGIIGLVWFATNGPNWGGFGGWIGGMMGGYHSFMGGGEYGFFSVISIFGLISGAIMIVGAVMLALQPQEHLTWGVLILVFALVSFVDMGGYFIGGILGVIGGAFAISYRPPPMPVMQSQFI